MLKKFKILTLLTISVLSILISTPNGMAMEADISPVPQRVAATIEDTQNSLNQFNADDQESIYGEELASYKTYLANALATIRVNKIL